MWLFPAMVAYPEKQRKCQEELDAVVGRSRLPTFEDRDHLPYVTATVRELLRWRPTAPLGVFLYASVATTAHLRHGFRCSARYKTGRKILLPIEKRLNSFARMTGMKAILSLKAHTVLPISGTPPSIHSKVLG